MRVELMPGIKEISGATKPSKNGTRLVFMTRTNNKGKRETRLYVRDNDSYQRKSKPSDKEIALRKRFGTVASAVARIIREGHLPGSKRKELNQRCMRAYDHEEENYRTPTAEDIFNIVCTHYYPHLIKQD